MNYIDLKTELKVLTMFEGDEKLKEFARLTIESINSAYKKGFEDGVNSLNKRKE